MPKRKSSEPKILKPNKKWAQINAIVVGVSRPAPKKKAPTLSATAHYKRTARKTGRFWVRVLRKGSTKFTGLLPKNQVAGFIFTWENCPCRRTGHSLRIFNPITGKTTTLRWEPKKQRIRRDKAVAKAAALPSYRI